MSWLARTIPSHAIYLEASPATFVNDSEFESSKGLPKLTIAGSYGLFIRQDYPGIRLVPFFTPPYPRRQQHNPTRNARSDRVWPMKIDLSANIPLRIRPNKGRRAYPFLTYSHIAVLFIVSISTLPHEQILPT